MNPAQEHAMLAVILDSYANRVRALVDFGVTTHRALITVMMEEELVAGPDEASAILDLLVATRRLRKAESALGIHASGLYLQN